MLSIPSIPSIPAPPAIPSIPAPPAIPLSMTPSMPGRLPSHRHPGPCYPEPRRLRARPRIGVPRKPPPARTPSRSPAPPAQECPIRSPFASPSASHPSSLSSPRTARVGAVRSLRSSGPRDQPAATVPRGRTDRSKEAISVPSPWCSPPLPEPVRVPANVRLPPPLVDAHGAVRRLRAATVPVVDPHRVFAITAVERAFHRPVSVLRVRSRGQAKRLRTTTRVHVAAG